MIELIEEICQRKDDNNIIIYCKGHEKIILDTNHRNTLKIHPSFVEITREIEDISLITLLPYTSIYYVEVINNENLDKIHEKAKSKLGEVLANILKEDKEEE